MTNFTVRIELNNPKDEDYEDLHEKMENAKFNKTIKSSDGVIYKLPDAEYDYSSSTETTEDVLDKAYDIAKSVRSGPRVLVTKSNGRMWRGLKKA